MMMVARNWGRPEDRVVEGGVGEVDASHCSVRTRVRAMNVWPEEGQQRMKLAADKSVTVRAIPASVRDHVHEGVTVGKRGSCSGGDTGERNIERWVIRVVRNRIAAGIG